MLAFVQQKQAILTVDNLVNLQMVFLHKLKSVLSSDSVSYDFNQQKISNKCIGLQYRLMQVSSCSVLRKSSQTAAIVL